VRLEEIETGERLFDRHMSGMYPGATDSLILWWLTYGPALLAAAKTAASERSRADKAEAELERLQKATWIKATKHLIAEAHNIALMVNPTRRVCPLGSDDWIVGVREDDLRRLERAADLARAALKGNSDD
jgi:hypothetical protein